MKIKFANLLTAAVLGTLLLSGCSSPQAPGWPSGEERPINAKVQKTSAVNQGVNQ